MMLKKVICISCLSWLAQTEKPVCPIEEMSGSFSRPSGEMKLFDSHCHLQDPRIYNKAPELIRTALNCGVLRFAVNGVSEKDWHVVKQMSEHYPSCIVPCFGLHPWFVAERTSNWLSALRELFHSTPSAAVGEFQVQVFQQQLELAKELERPVSIHCVRAFGDLLEIMQKAKRMLKTVPTERILLESDSPDALPKSNLGPLLLVPDDASVPKEFHEQVGDAPNVGDSLSQFHALNDASALPKETLNHPANIYRVLHYVASLLEMSEEELAEISYRNAMRLFSYPGSRIN